VILNAPSEPQPAATAVEHQSVLRLVRVADTIAAVGCARGIARSAARAHWASCRAESQCAAYPQLSRRCTAMISIKPTESPSLVPALAYASGQAVAT
jgi:hypothetical protein